MSSLVFAALADPNRRRIIELLTERGSATATGLAAELSISRQATAKHLAQLADAGLASSSRSGRETRFQARTEALGSVTGWVERVEDEWRRRLDDLAQSLDP